MNDLPILNYISERATAAGIDLESLNGPSGTTEHMLCLVFRSQAKLPLDRVTEVAAFIGCDARDLFRVALAQFYNGATIHLLESMLAPREMSVVEEAWLRLIRCAGGDGLEPPSRVGRRLLWALLRRSA